MSGSSTRPAQALRRVLRLPCDNGMGELVHRLVIISLSAGDIRAEASGTSGIAYITKRTV